MDSYKRIQVISLIGIFLAFVVVGLGAWTRLVDAGLGCPDWPGCYGYVWMPETESEIEQANIAYPERQFEVEKAIPEVVHRYFAGTLGLLIFGLFFIAIIAKTKDKWLKNLIYAATVLVCVQSLFGYLTVSLKLWPQVVTLHLLGGFFTTTLVFLIFLRSSHLRSSLNINFSVLPKTNTLLNWAFPFLLAQIILGVWLSSNYAALACPDFPTCQGSYYPEMDFESGFNLKQEVGPNYLYGLLENPARVAIHYSHRVTALVLTFFMLILIGCLWFTNAAPLSSTLGLVLLLQISLGIMNVVYVLPLYIAIAHNLIAAMLLLVTLLVNYLAFKK